MDFYLDERASLVGSGIAVALYATSRHRKRQEDRGFSGKLGIVLRSNSASAARLDQLPTADSVSATSDGADGGALDISLPTVDRSSALSVPGPTQPWSASMSRKNRSRLTCFRAPRRIEDSDDHASSIAAVARAATILSLVWLDMQAWASCWR